MFHYRYSLLCLCCLLFRKIMAVPANAWPTSKELPGQGEWPGNKRS
ncbi:MAG: hypothetical protein OZSIB_2529 [Candidatus Ozemobacter sibiricus]|uniref:Uncharacterized protein n=1 Tax=Candidatus Ozemobacter sibiricus TaxID=2268124 RepID=A0A367ZUW1_9BACT|nr:MAG: hypothetical protein OZSIB_2529 [Candidatus Ozemobacter sibiricus]